MFPDLERHWDTQSPFLRARYRVHWSSLVGGARSRAGPAGREEAMGGEARSVPS